MAKKKKAAGKSAEQPSIEAAMEELQDIVQILEGGQEPLDVSLQKFERGMTLLRSCHQQLEQAASKIEILTGVDSEGRISTARFDGTSTLETYRTQQVSDSDQDDDSDEDGVDPASLF